MSEGPTLARFSARWTLSWQTLCPHRMSGLCLHRALALYLLLFWMPSSDAFLKGFDFVDAESPGRSCMVHGRSGVCMYSMVCTYAGGQHLGTCRLASASHIKVEYVSQQFLCSEIVSSSEAVVASLGKPLPASGRRGLTPSLCLK